MPLTPSQLTTLKTEFTTDPRGYGYSTLWASGQDNALADVIDTVRDGTNPPANPTGGTPAGNADGHIDIKRDDVAGSEVVLAIDLADIPSLPTNPNNSQLSSERRSLAYLQMLACMTDPIKLLNDDGSNTPVISNVAGIFTAGSATLTRLNALRFRFGSRAEELFGKGVSVTADDVSACRRV